MTTSPLWTQRRRAAVQKFVAEARRRLKLSDWEIIVDFETSAGPDAFATINRHPHQRRATLTFNAALFLNEPPHLQRQTLVHELLHCHLFAAHEAGEVAVAAVSGKRHRETLSKVLRAEIESATDALADAFVAFVADLPVPGSVAPLLAREVLTPGTAPTAPIETRRPRHLPPVPAF